MVSFGTVKIVHEEMRGHGRLDRGGTFVVVVAFALNFGFGRDGEGSVVDADSVSLEDAKLESDTRERRVRTSS